MVDETSNIQGFKFAVTVIIAVSTIVYAIYNYIENNPITPNLFTLLFIFLSLFCIIVLGLIVYLFLQAITLEIDDQESKISLKK
jgi:hypothetical protein